MTNILNIMDIKLIIKFHLKEFEKVNAISCRILSLIDCNKFQKEAIEFVLFRF